MTPTQVVRALWYKHSLNVSQHLLTTVVNLSLCLYSRLFTLAYLGLSFSVCLSLTLSFSRSCPPPRPPPSPSPHPPPFTPPPLLSLWDIFLLMDSVLHCSLHKVILPLQPLIIYITCYQISNNCDYFCPLSPCFKLNAPCDKILSRTLGFSPLFHCSSLLPPCLHSNQWTLLLNDRKSHSLLRSIS